MNKNIRKKLICAALIVGISAVQIGCTTMRVYAPEKPATTEQQIDSSKQNKSSNDTNHKTSPQNNITNKNKSNDTNKKSNTKDISKWEDYAQWSYDNYGSVPHRTYAYTDQDGNSVYYEDDNYNPDYPSSNTENPGDNNDIESATTE